MSQFWIWSVVGYGEGSSTASVFGSDGLVFRTREEAQANLDEFLSRNYFNGYTTAEVVAVRVA